MSLDLEACESALGGEGPLALVWERNPKKFARDLIVEAASLRAVSERLRAENAALREQLAARETVPGDADKLRSDLSEAHEALRELAFYVGNGGYNAPDPISVPQFVAKIRDGISREASEQLLDCKRYRRLRTIGCAPYGTKALNDSTVVRCQSLDAWVDEHMEHTPSELPRTAPAMTREAAYEVVERELRAITGFDGIRFMRLNVHPWTVRAFEKDKSSAPKLIEAVDALKGGKNG